MSEFEIASKAMEDYMPAFPNEMRDGDRVTTNFGMSLLDYFAAKAMQSAIINEMGAGLTFQARAEFAYSQAQAMLTERAKRTQS
jgi:hypothetical protein